MSGMPDKPTPMAVFNRPGLSEITKRAGTHSRFYDAMLRGLADASRPGLSELKVRSNGDYSLGLMDAWSGVCDTLTFYTERSAQEAYLRTATERESVRAHARLIGYELAPAKAASTFLAFEAEGVDAPDEPLDYEAGIQARSVPRDGEIPQLFETIEPLSARASWNAMSPRMAYPQELTINSEEVSLLADAPRLSLGDPIVFLKGDAPQAFDNAGEQGFLRRVSGLNDGLDGRKLVALKSDPASAPKYVFVVLDLLPVWSSGTTLNTTTLGASVIGKSWSVGTLSTTTSLTQVSLATLSVAIQALKRPSTDPILPHLMTVRSGFYGNTAISKRTSPSGTGTTLTAGTYTTDAPGNIVETHDDIGNTAQSGDKIFIYLEREFADITPGTAMLIRDASNEAWVTVHAAEALSVEGYSMSAKVTRLQVDSTGLTPTGGSYNLTGFNSRTAVAYAVPQALPLSDLPITDAVAGDVVELDRAELTLLPGKTVAVTGEREDLDGITVSEIRTIKENQLNNGFSVLTFTQPLGHIHKRATVSINANVAEATHGETAHEILGDGDATKPFQTFALKSEPLTHVSAKTETGMAPSIEVRVDRVRWDLVEDFRDSGPDDRVYILRSSEDGKSHITFGDGERGQRLSTGQDNVEVTYRKGAGLDGHLEAGQLSLLATKPVGLKGVWNPLAPAGAADSEALEDARENAPLKVLTLGRVVSLRDYEDYARGFAAIAKARADWTFDGFARPIFVTVAGQEGVILPDDGEDMINLVASLQAAGEADISVTVRNYRPAKFAIAARLWIDPAYVADDVLDAARSAVSEAFSFDARALGQPVSHAQVIARLQDVDGVEGVDLDELYRLGAPPSLEPRLASAVATPDLGGAIPEPAELLTLEPAAITLEVAT